MPKFEVRITRHVMRIDEVVLTVVAEDAAAAEELALDTIDKGAVKWVEGETDERSDADIGVDYCQQIDD